MLDLDHVESQFRASVKTRARIEPPRVERVLVVSDLPTARAQAFTERVEKFLKPLSPAHWSTAHRGDVTSVEDVLNRVQSDRPDLVVCYRHLFEADERLAYSLGTYADMLTQATPVPLLLLPRPDRPDFEASLENTDRVLVVTNHVVGDGRLISWGLVFTEPRGTLELAHIEDDAVFQRYIDAISKIPDIPTEQARKQIHAKLLKEASNYMEDATRKIRAGWPQVNVEHIVRMGHRVKDYRSLVLEREVDVLVFNTKDEDQLAMHGVAYSLAIELVNKPLLML